MVHFQSFHLVSGRVFLVWMGWLEFWDPPTEAYFSSLSRGNPRKIRANPTTYSNCSVDGGTLEFFIITNNIGLQVITSKICIFSAYVWIEQRIVYRNYVSSLAFFVAVSYLIYYIHTWHKSRHTSLKSSSQVPVVNHRSGPFGSNHPVKHFWVSYAMPLSPWTCRF